MTNVSIVDELVSSKIVAKVLGISSRRVQQLTEDGIILRKQCKHLLRIRLGKVNSKRKHEKADMMQNELC